MATLRIVSTTFVLAVSALAGGPASPAAAPAAGPEGDAVIPAPGRLRSGAGAGTPTRGVWAVTVRQPEGVQLSLVWESSTWASRFPREELRGLTEAQIASAASSPVSFRLEREAGAFQMEGTFQAGQGTGRFRFQPERGFARTLASLGVRGAEHATDGDLMFLALGGATASEVREFAALDLGPLALGDVIALGVHRVTPEYVREVRSLGLSGTGTVGGVVELRVHGVSLAFVRELEAAGYRDLPREQLMVMGVHGVSGEQVRALAAAGYPHLSPSQLVDMRLHQVTPAFIHEMRETGFRDLRPEELVELRLHSVSREYVRELQALGYRDLPRAQLLQMGIHGVTPAFIRQVRAAGFTDVSPRTLVQMKIQGIDPELAKRGVRGGR
jgi:hypothetical protein